MFFSLLFAMNLLWAKTDVAFLAGFNGSDPRTANEIYRGVDVFFAIFPDAQKLISVEKFDTRSQISETVAILQKIKEKGIKVVVGIHNSDEAIAVSKFVNANDMIFITPFSSNPKVTQQGNNTFRFCYTDDFQGKVLARVATQNLRKMKYLVLTNVNSNYANDLSRIFKSGLEVLRGKPGFEVKTFEYQPDHLETATIVNLVKEFKPEVVFLPDYITRAASIAKAVHETDKSIIFMGGDGFGGKTIFLDILGKMKDLRVYYTTHWTEAMKNKTNQQFVSKYKKLFKNDTPTSGASLTYDSMVGLYRALMALPESSFSASNLGTQLKKMTFDTTVGSLRFSDPDDNSPRKPVVLISFSNGAYKVEEVIQP